MSIVIGDGVVTLVTSSSDRATPSYRHFVAPNNSVNIFGGDVVIGRHGITGDDGVVTNVRIGSDGITIDDGAVTVNGKRYTAADGYVKRKRGTSKKRTTAKGNAKDEDQICRVCMENVKCMLFKPCGHFITCGSCATRIMGDKEPPPRCPICKTNISDVVNVMKCDYLAPLVS